MSGKPATSSSPGNAPKGAFLAVVDRVTGACVVLGDVMVMSIAVMLSFEVAARYIFNAPTIWTQDVAVALQVWFTYLGMAYVLRQRQLIRITAVLVRLGPGARRLLEGFSLLIIAAFSIMAVIYGWDVVADSFRLGRRQPTMLQMPNWIAELPVVLGFALLAIQATADLIRLPFSPAPSFSPGGEHATDEENR